MDSIFITLYSCSDYYSSSSWIYQHVIEKNIKEFIDQNIAIKPRMMKISVQTVYGMMVISLHSILCNIFNLIGF